MTAGHEQPTRPGGQEREQTISRAAAISRGIVGLISRYTGRGPTKARTTVNTNVVLVVLEDTLTKGEQNLVAAGQLDAVKMMRRTYHSAMRDEAIALVEGILDRKVKAALADIDPDADVVVETFVLERIPETGLTETAELENPGGETRQT